MGIDFSKFNRGKAQSRVEAPPPSAQGPKSSIFRIQDLPANIAFGYEWTEGTHIGDIVAVEVKNPMNPAVKSGALQVGDFDYGFEAWVHPANKNIHHSHLCIQRTYGIKDPRCQEYFRRPEEGGSFVKGVKGSGNQDHRSSWRRYIVWVPRDPSKPTVPGTEAFLVDTPADETHGLDLIGEAKVGGDDGGPVFFWWPTEEGRTVRFEVSKGKFENSWDFKRIKFLKRPAAVGSELHEKFSFSLDSLLIVPTVESMERDIYNAPPEDDEATATSAQASKHSEYKREEQEIPDDKRKDPDLDKKPEPGTDKVPKAEKPTTTAEASKGACPHGLEYGKSFEDKPEPRACRNCDVYEQCVVAGC